MSDQIVEAVARRWKQAAATSWVEDAEDIDAESAIDRLRQDFRKVKGYKAKCAYLAQIFRNLAGPLETPKIAEFADLIDKRIQDVDQLMGILQGGDKLLAKASKEFDQFIQELAKGMKLRAGYVEAIYDLPSMLALVRMADKGYAIQSRLHDEDDEGHIDWTLEEYIGSEAKIYSKLEKNGELVRGWFSGSFEFDGVWAIYGFLKYHLDVKYIKDLVDDAKSDLDIEEDGEGT